MWRLNVKFSDVLLLRLHATFHALPLFYLRTLILRTYARKTTRHWKSTLRSIVSVKVEPRSTSRLSSALFILPLMCVTKTCQWKSTISTVAQFFRASAEAQLSRLRVTFHTLPLFYLRAFARKNYPTVEIHRKGEKHYHLSRKAFSS